MPHSILAVFSGSSQVVVDVAADQDDFPRGQSHSLLPVALMKSVLYFQKMVPPKAAVDS